MSHTKLPEHVAFLGNHLPRLCGIATFTRDLCDAVSGALPAADCYVGAINDRPEGYAYPPRVRFEIQAKELDSYRRGADFLNFNNADILCVQHEFGIYGGTAGSHLLSLLKEVRMPVVTTLHTILQDPNPAQRKVMDSLTERSDRLVTMTQKGADLLRDVYQVPLAKVDIIPHGIPDVPFTESSTFKERLGVAGRQVLLTFGLIGPGKGIEDAIVALPEIVRQHPNVVYLILGATHPNLLAEEGERYRLRLNRLAEQLGVKDNVIFYNRFVSQADLNEFIGASDIYLTPYLNEAQITSGTLAYVFGAGKAVVSTPYWHAKELLEEDRGVLVPFHDPPAIATSVCALLNDPHRMDRIRRQAYALGREMIWSAIGQRYVESFQHARADHAPQPRAAFAQWTLSNRPPDLPPLRLDHIVRMSDATGIFQHAIFNVPNFHEGYCTDDNARSFILCAMLSEIGSPSKAEIVHGLASSYLAFLAAALNCDTGRFRNFMSHSRQWLEEAGSEDSHGRALWSVGTGASRSRIDGHRRLSAQLFEHGLPAVASFTSPRSWAFTLIGIHEYLRDHPGDPKIFAMRQLLTDKLVKIWKACSTEDWPWFEASVTYDNARLCQALLLSGQWTPHREAHEIGLKSLRWLASIQTAPSGCFRPIGSNGFYQRSGARADFDQQPVEAQAMVAACQEAYRTTHDPFWTTEAKRAFEWFLGRNDLGTPLYDFSSGGCSDGLHAARISSNQGAESTLAFHLALADMSYAQHLVTHPPTPVS